MEPRFEVRAGYEEYDLKCDPSLTLRDGSALNPNGYVVRPCRFGLGQSLTERRRQRGHSSTLRRFIMTLWLDLVRRPAGRIILATAVAVTTLVVPTALAEATGPSPVAATRIEPMDPDLCAWMTAVVKERTRTNPGQFTAQQHRKIDRAPSADCYVEVSGGIAEKHSTAFGVQTAAAATACGYRYGFYKMYSAGINTATAHMNTRMCWNGTTRVWHDNYHSCYLTTIPGFLTDEEACTTISNNTRIATDRHDFRLAAVSAPFWWKHGWMAFKVEFTGYKYYTYGYCCTF